MFLVVSLRSTLLSLCDDDVFLGGLTQMGKPTFGHCKNLGQ